MKLKVWLKAFRLRTLPLSLSSIGMGSFLAASKDSFKWDVFLLCILTTTLLQILSNLANDYGDSIHGADSDARKGPSRAVQSGEISAESMKNGVVICSILSLISGLSLLWISLKNWEQFGIFLGLGILAILAAIAYTNGKKPYGYLGLGDISVLIFFGWVGVLGTLFLHSGQIHWTDFLPATSSGLFAVAVLNVNNVRDIESDKKAGKYSIPVRLGRKWARVYHVLLLGTGLGFAVLFCVLRYQSLWQFLFILTLPLFARNAWAVTHLEEPPLLDPYLKQMAITSMFFMLTFGIGLII
jgi:1,4-dihydroxy-2-naphthoate octaprenyltransferase